MTVVLMGQDKPEEIKADLKARWEAASKLQDKEPVKFENEANEIVANDKFKKYGGELYRGIVKQMPVIHKNAEEQKAAEKDVAPFLSRVKVSKSDPKKLEAEADALYEEARSLLSRYQTSSYGPELTAIRDEMMKFQEEKSAGKGQINKDYFTLAREVRVKFTAGDCKGAQAQVSDFETKYKENADATVLKNVAELKDQIKRGAEDFVKKKNNETQNMVKDGKKKEALAMLEGCRAGLEGYPAALEKLEAAIKGLKP